MNPLAIFLTSWNVHLIIVKQFLPTCRRYDANTGARTLSDLSGSVQMINSIAWHPESFLGVVTVPEHLSRVIHNPG